MAKHSTRSLSELCQLKLRLNKDLTNNPYKPLKRPHKPRTNNPNIVSLNPALRHSQRTLHPEHGTRDFQNPKLSNLVGPFGSLYDTENPITYLRLVGNGGMGYNYNYDYYHSSIPY